MGRVAVGAPDQLDRLPVDRHGHRPRLGGHRRELVERAEPERIGLVHAEAARAVPCQLALEARLVAALGQPEAPAPALEAPLVGGRPHADLQPPPAVRGQQRQQRVGGRARPQLHALERAEGADQVPAQRLERRLGARVVARRAAQLGGQQRLAGALQLVGVELVHGRADVAQEGDEALARLPGEGLQLVTEHRRQAQRDRAARAVPRAVAGTRSPAPPRAIPRRRARCRSLRRRACGCAGRAPMHRGCRVSGLGCRAHRQMARKSSALSSGASRSVKSDAEIAGTKRS